VTSTTFIGRVLRLLGLTSIADAAKGAAASGGYPQLSAEFILEANPTTSSSPIPAAASSR